METELGPYRPDPLSRFEFKKVSAELITELFTDVPERGKLDLQFKK